MNDQVRYPYGYKGRILVGFEFCKGVQVKYDEILAVLQEKHIGWDFAIKATVADYFGCVPYTGDGSKPATAPKLVIFFYVNYHTVVSLDKKMDAMALQMDSKGDGMVASCPPEVVRVVSDVDAYLLQNHKECNLPYGMDDPRQLEGLEEELYNANQKTPVEKLHFVAFICTAALPYGLIYKENLDVIPSVQDVYHALEKYQKTHHIALPLIKYALGIAGCPPQQIALLHGESVQERTHEISDHDFSEDLIRKLKFRELLIDIDDDLTGEEKKAVINFGRPFLKRGADYTPSLLVHFLLLLQNDLIGVRNVDQLIEWLSILGRRHTIDKVGKYCSDYNIPVQARNIPLPASCEERRSIARGHVLAAPPLSRTAPLATVLPQSPPTQEEGSQNAEEQLLISGQSSPIDLPHPNFHPFLSSQEATSRQGHSALLVHRGVVPMQEEVDNNTDDHFTLDSNVEEDCPTESKQLEAKMVTKYTSSGRKDEVGTGLRPADGDFHGSMPHDSSTGELQPLLSDPSHIGPPSDGLPFQTHRGSGRGSCKRVKWWCCIATCCGLSLSFLLFLGVLLSYLFQAPPMSANVYLQKGDNVLTRKGGFSPYYFLEVDFSQSTTMSYKMEDERPTVVFYQTPCANLRRYNETIDTDTFMWNITSEESHKFKIRYEGYLLKGSELEYHINVTGIGEFLHCSAALYIFRDPETYKNFFDSEGQEGFEAHREYCIPISQSASYHKPYIVRPTEDSYYFSALYVPTGAEGGRSISYKLTGTLMYYGNTSHSFTCHLEPNKATCSTPIELGRDICILATAVDDEEVCMEYSTQPGIFVYIGSCGCALTIIIIISFLLFLYLYLRRNNRT